MGVRRRSAVAAATAAVLGASLSVPLAGVPASAVSTDQSYWIPAGKTIRVNGHGYGHGHGMSQHGAQGAALAGLSYREIADFYYPGTTWGEVRGRVRVVVTADTSDDVVVSPAEGLAVRDLADGSTHVLPVGGGVSRWRIIAGANGSIVQMLTGGQWSRLRVRWNRALTGDAEFFAATPITLWTPSGARTYRGTLRSAGPVPGGATRDTVNVVRMDQYVMGVVPYEMPASWHAEAVRAQAVAARTYATWSRAQNPHRYYQICDTTACQVYSGTGGEDARSNAAVKATARRILLHQGRPAFTQFSASSGGWTAAGSVPYLTAKQDPYDGWSGNYNHSWSTTVDAGVLERKYPSLGRLERIRVTTRDGNGDWQGRVRVMVLDGSAGDVTISGDAFRWTFGLKSNWFSIAPTPIMSRWARIGGVESPLGAARRGEIAVAAGVAQEFQRGQMFHSRATGARELFGPILRTYRALGGPSSALGFPRTPVRARGTNRLAHFESGGIYHRRTAAPVAVMGAIDARFRAEGALRSGLGWPTKGNYSVPGGQRADFENGSILYKRRTDSTQVIRH